MATKVIKNNTASPVDVADVGFRIPASGQVTLSPQEFALWAASNDLKTLVDASTLTINDGTNDISTASVAKEYMGLGTEAFGLRFLPNAVRSNGFTSTNVQEAIEEAAGMASGISSLSAIGSSPNANAATITGTVLNLQPASASFGGVVTTGTQTFAGAKTFSSDATFSGQINNSNYTAGSVLFSDGTKISQDNSTFYWDNTNKRLGVGITPSYDLHVQKTNTDTSGTLSTGNFTKTLNPGSNSTATQVNLDSVIVTAGTIYNKANAINVARHLSYRNASDSGNIISWTATVSQILNQAVFGTGSGSFGTAIGHNVQVSDNSSTTTASTTMRGIQISVSTNTNVSASRVITNYDAFYASLSTNSAAGTTYTNARVATFDPSVSANQGGTFTNGIAVLINPWTTTQGTGAGVTYTNAPEQLRLASMSVANSIAIRQQGSTPHNRFEGSTMIGSDAAPSATLEIKPAAGSGTLNPEFLVTAGAHTALTASTEHHDINLNLGRTVQWATGALTTQRFFRVQAPTVGFVGASTLTNASTMYIDGAPSEGSNATITNAYSMYIGPGGGTGVTNTYGLYVDTPAGYTSVGYSGFFTNGKFVVRDAASSVGIIFGVQANSGAHYFWVSNTETVFANNDVWLYDGRKLYGGFNASQDFEISSTSNVTKGNIILNAPVKLSAGRNLILTGGTSGTITFAPAGTITSHTLTLPSAQGAANSFLKNDGSGNLSWNVGTTVMRHYLVGFVNGVSGSNTKTAGTTDLLNTNGVYMENAGTVTSIAIIMSSARTAGTCTAKWLKNGVVQSGTAVIDGMNTTQKATTGLSVAYSAGDVLTLQTVTSSFTPTGADASITLWCQE